MPLSTIGARNRSADNSDAVAGWTKALVQVAESIGQQFSSHPNRLVTDFPSVLANVYQCLFDWIDAPQALNFDAEPFLRAEASWPLTAAILGSTYERILDCQPVLNDGVYSLQAVKQQRKSTGSYYTPPLLVDTLVDTTLAPLVADKLVAAAFLSESVDPMKRKPIDRWSAEERQRAETALLAIRICDPSCGPGAFLLAAGEFLAQQLVIVRSCELDHFAAMIARRDVFGQCVCGVDLDPLAIELARLSLWLEAGRPGKRAEFAADSFRVGDSLAVFSDESGPKTGIDWPEAFPKVIAKGGGFDAIFGNPPFANAIEGAVSDAVKKRLSTKYPELTGTADLGYYFFALSHRICNPDGTVGLVLPRGVLTGRSIREFRERLLLERPPSLIYAPDNQYLFPGADIFVVLLALRKGTHCLGSRDASQPRFDPIHVKSANWWAPLIDDIDEARTPGPRVGDLFEVSASMTTGMAYDLRPFIGDEPRKHALRFVTTGLIDPDECHWGRRVCRYLKVKYLQPIIHEEPTMPAMVATRIAKMRRPKILVAGLSIRVEAFLDVDGQYCGAVSTFTIFHPEDDIRVLKRLCKYLNSPPATRALHRELGAHAMGGGRITLSKDFLRYLPFE